MRDLLTREQAEAIRTMSERLGGSPVLEAIASLGPSKPKFAAGEAAAPSRAASADRDWVDRNLRRSDQGPYLDLANLLRIIDRHPEFCGRFRFNPGMSKVLDRGRVMLAWQFDELAAVIQERFLPGVPETLVAKAVIVAAQRAQAAVAPEK